MNGPENTTEELKSAIKAVEEMSETIKELARDLGEMTSRLEDLDKMLPKAPRLTMRCVQVEGKSVPAIVFDGAFWVRNKAVR